MNSQYVHTNSTNLHEVDFVVKNGGKQWFKRYMIHKHKSESDLVWQIQLISHTLIKYLN